MTKQHAPALFWRCLAGRSWALVMAAAWSLAGANGDIVIGELALQRPEASIEAAAYMSGLQLSLDQANAAGGVRGRRVVLARAPNVVAMDQAAAEAERLLSGPAVALVGFLQSGTARALAEPAAGVLRTPFALIGAQAFDDGMKARFLFHTRASLADEVRAICRHLATIGLTRVVMLTGDSTKSAQADEGLRDSSCMALQVRDRIELAGGALEGPSLGRLQRAEPQAVMLVAEGREAAAAIEHYRLAQGSAQIFATSSADVERLARRLPDEMLRGLTIAQVVPSPFRANNALSRSFAQAHAAHAATRPPSFTMMEGYVTGRVLLAALKRIEGPVGRAAVVAALEGLQFEDLGGYHVSFAQGQRRGSRFVELSIVDSARKVRQ